MDNKHIHLKWQFPPNLTPLYSLQNVFRQHCGNRFSTWTYHGEYVVVFFLLFSAGSHAWSWGENILYFCRSCVWTLLVKKYEKWKNSSHLSVGFSESPFLETAYAIPHGLFSLYSYYFFFSPLCSPPLSFLLSWSGHTSTPSSSSSFVVLLYLPLKETPSTHHIQYLVTDPLLSVSLPAEPSITGSDVDGSERGQIQSGHRTAVIPSASVCAWPHVLHFKYLHK